MSSVDPSFWRDRRVLLTGHTGFKGAWLSLWLQSLGAKVTGFSVDVPTQPSLYELAKVGEGMGSIEGALLGGFCVGVVQSVGSYYVAPAFGQLFFFVLFLLVMIFRPNGLFGQKGAATLGMNENA